MKLSDELLFQLRKKDGSLSTIQHLLMDILTLLCECGAKINLQDSHGTSAES